MMTPVNKCYCILQCVDAMEKDLSQQSVMKLLANANVSVDILEDVVVVIVCSLFLLPHYLQFAPKISGFSRKYLNLKFFLPSKK